MAFQRASETDRLPLGIFSIEEGRPTFEENVGIFQDNATPLFKRTLDTGRLRDLIETYRGKITENHKGGRLPCLKSEKSGKS